MRFTMRNEYGKWCITKRKLICSMNSISLLEIPNEIFLKITEYLYGEDLDILWTVGSREINNLLHSGVSIYRKRTRKPIGRYLIHKRYPKINDLSISKVFINTSEIIRDLALRKLAISERCER